jgi:thioredoxin-like negative regulator of GroEL
LTAFNAMILGTFESRPTATPGISEITLNGKPHYIRFTATWCQPCRQMRPAVQAMIDKYSAQVNFWDVDVDNSASRRLIQRYNVEFIPYTVLLDSRGRTFRILEGLRTRQELDRAIQALLANE